MKRKQPEIDAEIKRLSKLIIIGTHADLIQSRVNTVIEVLRGKKPATSTPAEREIVAEAWRWKEGIDDALPSQGWQSFVRS